MARFTGLCPAAPLLLTAQLTVAQTQQYDSLANLQRGKVLVQGTTALRLEGLPLPLLGRPLLLVFPLLALALLMLQNAGGCTPAQHSQGLFGSLSHSCYGELGDCAPA